MEKLFYKRISNYIKTCSTTPNTGKFARVNGWAKNYALELLIVLNCGWAKITYALVK